MKISAEGEAELPVMVVMLKEIYQDSAPAFNGVVWNTAPDTLADETYKKFHRQKNHVKSHIQL